MQYKKPRTIITTDMECDDMNSLIHLCLYLNEFELEGIVYTSSQFHFNGDGVHTLGEVTPHYCCQGMRGIEDENDPTYPSPDTPDLKSYRPFEMGWIENLFRNEYAAVYPKLSQHAEGFPTPEEMLDKIYLGNYEFEGDVRHETDGSRMIESCIMDEREDTLYLQSWGGVNTIVRALMSIHEKYGNTPEWPAVRKKVTDKIAILGVFGGYGQDNSFLDQKIPEIYPGIKCLRAEYQYASFLTAHICQEDTRPLMQSEYMFSHIKDGHGPLLAKYSLYGDGTIFEGEPYRCQMGIRPIIDWPIPGFVPHHFDKYDILGEGDSDTYIPLMTCFGLRGLDNYRYGTVLGQLRVDDNKPHAMGEMMGGPKPDRRSNPFLRAYHEDFAARADWCVKDYDEANHNPVVEVTETDMKAAPGETVKLQCSVSDVRPYSAKWWLYEDGSSYEGDFAAVPVKETLGLKMTFAVPADAKPGDWFNLIQTVKNEAENPMTSYAQIIVHIV